MASSTGAGLTSGSDPPASDPPATGRRAGSARTKKRAEPAERVNPAVGRRRGDSVLDESPIAQAMSDLEGNLVAANEAYLRLMRTSLDALMAWPVEERLDEAARASFADDVSELLEGTVTLLERERRLRRPDGSTVWVHGGISLVRDGDDLLVHAVLHDITERREAEQALRESESLLRDSEARSRAVIESLHEGVIVHDYEEIIAANDSAKRIIGLPPGKELTLDYMASLKTMKGDGSPVDNSDRPSLRALITGEPQFAVLRGVVREDGEVRWCLLNAVPLFHPDSNEPYAAILSFSDITSRKTTEDEMRESETRYRKLAETLLAAQEETARLASIVESTSDLVGIVDYASGEMLYMNKAGRDMLGPADNDERPNVRDLFTDEAQTTLQKVAFPALQDGEVWSGELAMHRAHGGDVQVWLNLVGHADNDGKLQHISAVGRDVTERRKAAEVLTHQATHDSLTDLPNRTLLLAELEDALIDARANGTLLGLLFLDLDRFKGVNDSLGHDAGDELLVEAARRIADVLRPGDLVARLGGDEFVVVCRDMKDQKQATAIAQRITTAIETAPIVVGTHELSITASIGVALSDGGFAHPESLLRDADAAMYRAKDLGRARLEIFDESMRRRTLGRVEIADQLAEAIESGQIAVYYQPVYSIKDGKVASVEALARWNHPTRGLLLPKEFIEVAEETGQVVGLGLQVLTKACSQGRAWEQLLGDNAPRVNVNLSARQLFSSNIPDLVDGVLQRSELSPHKLCLEITESTLMEDAPVVIDTLWALKALGVVLAIDDFGTGYSSLSYLRKFPVDVIKVDQSFIDGLGPDPEDSAIVAAIIGLAHTLELEAVAEGVETPEQLERLRELGCHAAQGFMFAEPQLAGAITPLLTVFDAADRLRQR